ncbi:MAG: hypothetical protein ACK51C_02840 [Brevundimonas sp.]|uniref:hypothetical protein n=1 Tax=Brevundimonas sp. TaxID=1871086 RepID=UPI00391F1254
MNSPVSASRQLVLAKGVSAALAGPPAASGSKSVVAAAERMRLRSWSIDMADISFAG